MRSRHFPGNKGNMIFKKQSHRPDRKVNPLIGVVLFLISMVLLLLTGPLGFIYGILHSLFTKGLRGLGEYLLKIAISIDQLGNVLMQHLLNILWIKKGGYGFGNRDETISSALGRNRQLGTLTYFGLGIDTFLDLIDPGHSLNSIDYYIEPSPAIIDRVAWIYIRDGKVLFLKERNRSGFYLPGGDKIAGSPDAGLLAGYLTHLLGIRAETEGIEYLGTYESRYGARPPAAFIRQHCYAMPFRGSLRATGNLELYWFGYENREGLSEADGKILAGLQEKGLLS